MKRGGFILLFVAMILLGTCGMAFAATSANFEIKVQILSPIEIQTVNGLDFGRVFKGSPATTVNPANPLAGTTPAAFQVLGEQNNQFVVTLPTTANISNGIDTLVVDNFVSTLTDNTGVLDTNGQATFKVGATLQAINAAATSGLYSGSATVTVAYKF